MSTERRLQEVGRTVEAITMLTNRVVDMTLEIRQQRQEDNRRFEERFAQNERHLQRQQRIWIAMCRKWGYPEDIAEI